MDSCNQQPQVVVMSQPNASTTVFAAGQNQWSSNKCACFDDPMSCLFALFCGPCFMCKLATSLQEHYCGPLCCGVVFTTALRTRVRTMYGIKGTICDDICQMTFCGFCAALQIHRELKNRGHTC